MLPLPSGNEIYARSFRFPVADPSQVGEVRRFVASLAADLELTEILSGRLSIIVNEFGSNLLHHAHQGEIIVRALNDHGPGIELIAIDRGPGIKDVIRSLEDGYSTGTTPGTGLGAIKRQASVFDIFSEAEKGTVVLASVYAEPNRLRVERKFDFGVICLPLESEDRCGDAWAIRGTDDACSILLVDGLGHGPAASEAALAAIEAFEKALDQPMEILLETIHQRLRSTRGAAVFSARVLSSVNDIRFAGLGNIRGIVWHDGVSKGLISQSGTAGVQMRNSPSITQAFPRGGVLILSSDGLDTRWNLQKHPGLSSRHPSVIAGVLYRDHSRGRDDVTVFVGKRK